jgi:hypothetical protein
MQGQLGGASEALVWSILSTIHSVILRNSPLMCGSSLVPPNLSRGTDASVLVSLVALESTIDPLTPSNHFPLLRRSSPFGCQIQMQMAYAQTEAPTPIPYWPITTDTFGRPNIAATLVSAMNHNHQCSSQFGHASCVIQMKRTEMHGARARLHFLCADSLDTSDLLATRSLARCLPRRARVHAEQTSNN